MDALREQLQEVVEHLHDERWLSGHADGLYTTLEAALNAPPQINDAIEVLISLCPYLFTRRDFKRWAALLYDALINAQLLQDNELQTRIWAQMGENHFMAGQPSKARNAFETALQRAKQGRTREMMLAAYVGIIRLQSLRMDADFNSEFAGEALKLCRQVDDPAIQAHLYHALAIAYTHRGDTVAALGYGQIAYARWYEQRNILEMARTAFTLAAAYRVGGCISQAERLLALSSSLFTQTDYPPSYWATAYEEGILSHQHEKYEAAQQWLTLALDEAIKLDHPHYITMTRHALAVTQIHLQQFQTAEANLRTALAGWESLDNLFYQANVYQALGYLEGQRGNIELARDWLKQGMELCVQIPDSPFRQMIERLIAETQAELE